MSQSVKPILPGAAIGVLGSGQLGRMFAIAARQMGYRVHTFSPESDTPTGQVADTEVVASYLDLDAVRRFAQQVQVVTFEFENVPAECVETAAQLVPVRPAGSVLHITQNRLREKTFLRDNGFPTTGFAAVRAADDIASAAAKIGLPAVMKTAGSGYDGKGQAKVRALDDCTQAFQRWDNQEMIFERLVDFALEFSVIVARTLDGQLCTWGPIQNRHENHILDLSLTPAQLTSASTAEAIEMTHAVAEKLQLVGVLCIEFFYSRDGKILINELAPRPHNSGHLTIDACRTSQFEQQVRAVCGLPLGSAEFFGAAAMANLLGELWEGGEPDWAAACANPAVKLHLYGKTAARPGRKMGHLTAVANTAERAADHVLAARQRLRLTSQ
ncbi:MAG: 5-(carboxyamino)imidazole ribonucleotide synthase [Deltaproteobacteria bacterium]|nr:5-(carboxyamino)imidazole ribonucleotide synthase [Deltaproteobacteria bacterium]